MRKVIRWLVASLALSLATLPCRAAPETSQLTVGMLPIAAHAPLFAAQELGYFADEGLKVTPQFGVGGAALLPLIIQGQLQFGNVPISTALQARANNLDVVMIGPATYVEKSVSPGQTATIVKKGGSVTNLHDLGGKKIAVNVINSVNWLYNREMLSKAGVSVNTVTYVELPFPNMLDAVVNGQVDAAAIVQPFLYFGVSAGKVMPVGYDILDVQPGAQISGYAVSRKWALANPKTVAAFARALARAVDYLQANETQAVSLIAKFTRSTPEVIAHTGVPSWSNVLAPAMVQAQMQLMVKHGLLQRPQNVQDLIWSPAAPKN